MNFKLKQIGIKELNIVLDMFKDAADRISKKKIDHWQYWKNHPPEKINWVKEGLINKEFYFIVSINNEVIGMVRVLNKDLLYWGDKHDRARYIHSLSIKEKYNGLGLGAAVIKMIEAQSQNCDFIRLDCDSKNPQLCSYYLSLGFLKVGEKKLPLSIYNLYEKSININL